MSLFDQELKLFVTTGQITAGPPLAPLLGQYDIKPANEFINKLNTHLQEFEPGVPLAISVKRNSKTKNFKFVVNGPTLTCFIDNLSKRSRRRGNKEFILAKQIYDIAKIKHDIWLKLRPELCPPIEAITKSILATLKSSNIKLKLNLKKGLKSRKSPKRK
jgi:ribosomal protein L11